VVLFYLQAVASFAGMTKKKFIFGHFFVPFVHFGSFLLRKTELLCFFPLNLYPRKRVSASNKKPAFKKAIYGLVNEGGYLRQSLLYKQIPPRTPSWQKQNLCKSCYSV